MADQTPPVTPTAPAAPAPAPVPGTPEYDAAMVAKVDAAHVAAGGKPATAPAASPRPEHIPEKFWNAEKGEVNVEAMAKSYAELERTRTTPAAPVTPKAPTPGANLAVPDAAQATQAVADAGLDMGKLQAEFVEKGDLTPETRAALAAKGFPPEMVDGYIAGQRALAADYDASVQQAAGGADEYGKLTQWAQASLTMEEKLAFNKAVTSGDKAQAQFAVSGLKARHTAAFGSPPKLVQGGNTPVSGDVYNSMEEMKADMRKPEYRKDPAFNARVMQKAERSTFGLVQTRRG